MVSKAVNGVSWRVVSLSWFTLKTYEMEWM